MIGGVKRSDVTILTPCLELTLFFDQALSSVVEGLRIPVMQFIGDYGNELRWCRVDEMKRMRPAPDLLGASANFLFETPARWVEPRVHIYATSGIDPRDAIAPSLE